MNNMRVAEHAGRIEAALLGSDAARSPLVASWTRSARLHGLDPAGRADAGRLADAEFRAARERMGPLIAAAAPSLDRLFQAVGGVGCCVLLADPDGVPLDRRGAGAEDGAFREWGLWTGTVWSEARQGTNGIGTAIAERRTVTIRRDQHYLARNTALSCMTAPIFNHDGSLAGALDVSSCRDDLTEGFAGLIAHSVAETARRIEVEALRLAFPRARMVLVPGADRAAVLAVDADDLVVGATRAARQALGPLDDLPRPAADILGGTPDTLEAAERAALMRALARASGNVTAAARSLGISRATLHRKIAATRRG